MAQAAREALKQRVLQAVAARRDDILAVAGAALACPELGFREERTSALIQGWFERLGLKPSTGLAMTGVKALLRGSSPGPRIAVLAEMDAVVCPQHPAADPRTGAAHACGHHAQVAALVGVALGLIDSGAIGHLSGEVALIAVPAEEYVEIEYRQRLIAEGHIRFLGGKQELLRLGEFNGVHAVLMAHLSPQAEGKKAGVGGDTTGFVGKLVRYLGREAHAGAEPHRGVNALNAALLGLAGINALRETFREQDRIRVHPILTRGGDLVNVVPADVRLETYVRAATVEAMIWANRKVNRALRAGALALGAEAEITDLPGYLPRLPCPALDQVVRSNLALVLGEAAVGEGEDGGGSTDLGDVSQVVPSAHPLVGGVEGRPHSRDFRVVDPSLAYVVPAQILALSVVDLLADGGAGARLVRQSFEPALDGPEAYLRLWEALLKEESQMGPSLG
ncbi:MAG: amidohydrolase [Acetobacteraceae bacterium]|nr:amidohydrolase [Acetobacteraceae bacterium]